jgi:hypothetical protein
MESIVASLLNMYLGSYVHGLSKENFTFRLMQGDLILENLAVRKEALRDLKVPVIVRTGMPGCGVARQLSTRSLVPPQQRDTPVAGAIFSFLFYHTYFPRGGGYAGFAFARAFQPVLLDVELTA